MSYLRARLAQAQVRLDASGAAARPVHAIYMSAEPWPDGVCRTVRQHYSAWQRERAPGVGEDDPPPGLTLEEARAWAEERGFRPVIVEYVSQGALARPLTEDEKTFGERWAAYERGEAIDL